MYEIVCQRESDKVFVWADEKNVECWCISLEPYVFSSLIDAKIVYEQIIRIKDSKLTNVKLNKIE